MAMDAYKFDGGYRFFIKLFDAEDIDELRDIKDTYERLNAIYDRRDFKIIPMEDGVFQISSRDGLSNTQWRLLFVKYMNMAKDKVKISAVKYLKIIMMGGCGEGLASMRRPQVA